MDDRGLPEHRWFTLDRMHARATRLMRAAYLAGDHTEGAIQREEVDALDAVRAVLRSSGTGRSEAEAMRAACVRACEDRISYLEDPRRDHGTCMSYGRGELQSAIHLIRRIPAAARAALKPPAGQGEPETPHPPARGRGHGDG